MVQFYNRETETHPTNDRYPNILSQKFNLGPIQLFIQYTIFSSIQHNHGYKCVEEDELILREER